MEDYNQAQIHAMKELTKTIEILNKEIRESVVQINASIKTFSDNLLELKGTGSNNEKNGSSQTQENVKNKPNKTFAEAMEEIRNESNSHSSNIFKKTAADYEKKKKAVEDEIKGEKDNYAKSYSGKQLEAINKELDNQFKNRNEELIIARNAAIANADSFKEAYASIHKSAEENFIKMISGAQSFSTTYKNIFSNMFTQIQNAFNKYLYEQLLQKPINNLLNGIFGNLFGGIFGDGGSGGGSNVGSSGSNPAWSWSPSGGISAPFYAAGGLANGWSLVGEEGPELVNFSNPARVYNNKETRAALSGAQKTQSPIRITMNITSPDAGSFRQSKGQITAEVGRAISAATRRNT